jgi:hypothetical protein
VLREARRRCRARPEWQAGTPARRR